MHIWVIFLWFLFSNINFEMIDFNSISTHLGVIYAYILWNYIDCTFIFRFLCSCFFRLIDSFKGNLFWLFLCLEVWEYLYLWLCYWSILGWVISKTQKMVLQGTVINTQHYKVWIKGKVNQSREWSSTLSYTSVE